MPLPDNEEYVPTKEELAGNSRGYCYMSGIEVGPGSITPTEPVEAPLKTARELAEERLRDY